MLITLHIIIRSFWYFKIIYADTSVTWSKNNESNINFFLMRSEKAAHKLLRYSYSIVPAYCSFFALRRFIIHPFYHFCFVLCIFLRLEAKWGSGCFRCGCDNICINNSLQTLPFSTNCFRFPEYDGQCGRSALVAVGRGCRDRAWRWPIRARSGHDNSAVRWVIWQLLGNTCTCWIRSHSAGGQRFCVQLYDIYDEPLVNKNTLKKRTDWTKSIL